MVLSLIACCECVVRWAPSYRVSVYLNGIVDGSNICKNVQDVAALLDRKFAPGQISM